MISAKEREDAIDLLLADADARDSSNAPRTWDDKDMPFGSLAYRAIFAVWRMTDYQQSIVDDCLEAAALLRDGWCPGDPVVRL